MGQFSGQLVRLRPRLSLPQRIELVAAIVTRPDCDAGNGTGSANGVVCRDCLGNWHAPFAGLA